MAKILYLFDAKIKKIRRAIRDELAASNSRTRKLLANIDNMNIKIREQNAETSRKFFRALEGRKD